MITNRAFNAKKKTTTVNNIHFLKLNSGSIGPSPLSFSSFQRYLAHLSLLHAVSELPECPEAGGGLGRESWKGLYSSWRLLSRILQDLQTSTISGHALAWEGPFCQSHPAACVSTQYLLPQSNRDAQKTEKPGRLFREMDTP